MKLFGLGTASGYGRLQRSSQGSLITWKDAFAIGHQEEAVCEERPGEMR